jgi:trehalose 6-phosphate synthase
LAEEAADKKLILVSNRGPFSYARGESGELITVRGGGGLVTALLGVAANYDVTWIASAMTPEDSEAAAVAGGAAMAEHDEHQLRLRFVVSDPEAYNQFYNVIANPMIWFIQHYLWDLSVAPDIRRQELDAWENGYQVVNSQFADVVCEELKAHPGRKPLVMFHDYHLYTCPQLVRERFPDAFLHQFIHIPWPQSDSWRVLPGHIREAVIKGALANDIIAFHTSKYVRVRAYPISIDCADFERLAVSEPVLAEEEKIKKMRREKLILRVDRMDLSKNIVRGFKAYDIFLEEHPEFKERVIFLALMQPSREDVDEYTAYRHKIRRVVERINTKHGTVNWMPIDMHMQDNFPRSVAAYKQYDVLLVNAIYDGMNLIAKEAGLINIRDGVLILSENTGAHEELGDSALSVNPFDLEDQARAIHRALTMEPEEKAHLAGMLKETVNQNDIHRWIETQFTDISAKTGGSHER